jgi:hypothetical protein
MVLAALIVADWGIVAEVGRISSHNGPVYYHGGDSNWYYTTSWELANGRLPYAWISYGFSLVTAPIAMVAGPSLVAGLPAVIAFNQLVLAPIALLCIYGIARTLGGRGYAYLVSGLWVVFPVVVIHYFRADYHSRYVDMTLPSALGLSDRGDFPSLVVLLVAAYFTLRLAATGRDVDGLAAGLATGFAFAIKPSNILFAPAPLVALLVARRFRGLAVAAAATLPSVLGVAVWKQRGLGHVPAFTSAQSGLLLAAVGVTVLSVHLNVHKYLPFHWDTLHQNLDAFREYTRSQWIVFGTGIGGLIGLARRSSITAVLMGTWLGVFLLVKGSTPAVSFQIGSFLTHMIPAFPAYFLMLVSIPFLLPFYGRRRPAPSTFASGRHLPVTVAAILGVITLAGLVVVIALPKSATANSADVDGYFLVPINTFHLQANPVGRTVRLSWTSAGPGGRRARYTITRTSGGADCAPIPGASDACRWYGSIIGHVRGDRLSIIDYPPAGDWTYRIGQSVTPFGSDQDTDYIVLSTTAEVHIPARRCDPTVDAGLRSRLPAWREDNSIAFCLPPARLPAAVRGTRDPAQAQVPD